MYFEDYTVGDQYSILPFSLSEQEIIEFAEKYDARPFHLNQKAAEKTRFGKIIASGLHTICAAWGHWVERVIHEDHLVAGLSIESAKWLAPVYADERITGTIEVSHKRLFSSGKAGAITWRMLLKNEGGEAILEYIVTGMVEARPGD
ncbi:MAG: MaoC/PaaZ C-terminal domain-containing protein [Peptoniphilaceae bacterium]|nr:MaoC/PaaZ C-terminal domain-containing protein [Peptoniphilaceae bacterium]MDY3076344.1 MaoC/PaaZ C-terminal domain-containing protein [Peptoniphilaceae bacterium]